MKRFLALFMATVFFYSCAAPIIDVSQMQYKSDKFTTETLKRNGLALLPVVAGAGQEGIRRPLADKLVLHLNKDFELTKFMGARKVSEKINNAGLADDYAQLIRDYNTSAIVNKDTLQDINKVIEERYLLYVKHLGQYRSSKQRYSELIGNVITVKNMSVSIFAQVWDTQLGDVVWEGTGELYVESSEFTYITHTLDELVDRAAVSLLKNLPGFGEVKKSEKEDKGYGTASKVLGIVISAVGIVVILILANK